MLMSKRGELTAELTMRIVEWGMRPGIAGDHVEVVPQPLQSFQERHRAGGNRNAMFEPVLHAVNRNGLPRRVSMVCHVTDPSGVKSFGQK